MTRLIVAFVLMLSPAAYAAETACPRHFAGGAAPDLLNPRLSAATRAVCYQAYALLHSGATRTPLYSAEYLTRSRIMAARETVRQGDFHSDPNLPPEERADLRDYARSGYDRGHMAPSGDMPDAEAQQESFSLANIVPQAPQLNRGLWEGIESAVRSLAVRGRGLYVVTGPAFKASQLATIGNGVIVPTHVWKAVYDPARRQGAAYLAENADGATWRLMSVAELAAFTGIDVFPGMPAASRNRAMALPTPTPHNQRHPYARSGARF